MKKNIVLIFIFYIISLPVYGITERDIAFFFATIIAAQKDPKALELVAILITKNPKIIHVQGNIPNENCKKLSAIHVALFNNQGDELGLKLIEILKNAGADFNALTGTSANPFESGLNPLAFLFWRKKFSAVDQLIPILVEYKTSTTHKSVGLALRFYGTPYTTPH